MNRRKLLGGGLGTLAAGKLLAISSDANDPSETNQRGPSEMANSVAVPPPDVKLAVKPVMTNLIHSGVWEGPCRFNVVSVSEEKARVMASYDRWVKSIQAGKFTFGEAAEILAPALITFAEDFILPPAQLEALDRDSKNADVYFVDPSGSSIATFDVVKRFHKPAILFGLNCRTVDIAAYSKSRGEEVLVANDNDELEKMIRLLRARKVFRQTRILFPTDRGFPAVASLTGITDLNELASKFGILVKTISYKELSDEVDRTLNDPSQRQEAEQRAAELVRNAVHSYLDTKYVVRSVQFYQAINSLLKKHGCNAFTIECFEFCSSQLPQKWTITPCLIHALFKDRGFASACEGDLGALLAMRLLMSLSGKSSHLGNMFLGKGNEVIINHSVPGIRMNGFGKPGLPYKLGRFVKSGWGTKVVVDFMQNQEKRVTVARMHPSATKLLVLRGELVGSEGWDKDNLGCSVTALIKPVQSGAGDRFIRRQTEYGNHLVWVYGDYSSELEQLGRLLALEVEVIS